MATFNGVLLPETLTDGVPNHESHHEQAHIFRNLWTKGDLSALWTPAEFVKKVSAMADIATGTPDLTKYVRSDGSHRGIPYTAMKFSVKANAALTLFTGQLPELVLEDTTLVYAASYLGSASSSGAVSFDMNLNAPNGTSLFTTGGTAPPLIAQGSQSGLTVPHTVNVSQGDKIFCSCTAAGTNVFGAALWLVGYPKGR